jgi:hypothetical protein
MGRDILRQNVTLPAGLAALPPQQEQAITALLAGASVTAAAEKAGVARQTVHRWLADDPAFIAEYNLGRREMAEAVDRALRVLSLQSLRVLKQALTSAKTPPAVRVRAAVEVLKLTAAPPEGPTDVEDARNAIGQRDRRRTFAGMIARPGPGAHPGPRAPAEIAQFEPGGPGRSGAPSGY